MEQCKCDLLIPRIEKLEEKQERTEEFKNRVGAKLDRIEAHHQELLNQQTKQSGNITLLSHTVELQQQDRETKHKQLLDLINGIYKTFSEHTKEEMTRYDSIKEIQDDTKWKTRVMWGVMVAAGTGVMGLGFWLIREFIQKIN